MSTELYRIGAVSKITGITPECLRAWERRYGLTPAERAGKTRFYSQPQIEWLKKVKRLIDQGHPTSQLMKLDDSELDERLMVEVQSPRPKRGAVGLVGANLIIAERARTDSRIDVLGRWASLETFDSQLTALPPVTTIVLQLPSLDPQLVEKYQNFDDSMDWIVAYQFATQQDLEEAAQLDVVLLEWPTPWSDIEQACLRPRRGPARAARGGERRFTDDELVHIATMADRADCECPRHLVNLITQLNAFAVHSARCGRHDEQPLHAEVEFDSGAARAELETALDAFVTQHGLLQSAN